MPLTGTMNNTGIIALNSTGDEADLQVAHPKILTKARLRRETMGFLPFVGCEAQAIGERSRYAAASSVSFMASSMSTATTRDTPGSCIVMPSSWFAISMVILL